MIFVAKNPKQQRMTRGVTSDGRTDQKTRYGAQDRAARQSNRDLEKKVWPLAAHVLIAV
jgi:hypothetical protein